MFGKKKEKIREFMDGSEDLKDLKNLSFRDFLNGEVFTRSFVAKHLQYILFVTFLAFCYIANHYKVEALLTKMATVNKELKELRSISVTTSSELMQISKQSQVQKQVDAYGLGLKPLSEPPRILHVDK